MSKQEQLNISSYSEINNSKKPEQKKLYIKNPAKFGRACCIALALSTAIGAGFGAGLNEITSKNDESNKPNIFEKAQVAITEVIDNNIDYSSQMQEVVVEQGDTVYNMVQDNIENSNSEDPRELSYDVQNLEQNKEVFKDGVLQAGEVLTMPVSVEKP